MSKVAKVERSELLYSSAVRTTIRPVAWLRAVISVMRCDNGEPRRGCGVIRRSRVSVDWCMANAAFAQRCLAEWKSTQLNSQSWRATANYLPLPTAKSICLLINAQLLKPITIMSEHTIVLASRNKKKTQEVAELLAPAGFRVVPVTDFPDVPEVIEDGDTFAANAAKKATEVAVALGQWVIGEDSGLRVDALNGAPGIYSARYSGEGAIDESNNAKLVAELADVPEAKRGAGYVCSVALSNPAGEVRLAGEGTCRGRIVLEPRGDGGFGYDPYFLIPEFHQTFGQLSALVKHTLSHRARAFATFTPQLKTLAAEF